MAGPQVLRTALTWANGTSVVGLALALAARTALRRGPDGVLLAGGYRFPAPKQPLFTIGSVIFTRTTAGWLSEHPALVAHESRHVTHYALLGPLYWPVYWAASAYSAALTGDFFSRNVLERHAGLDAGGYGERPLRPWATRLRAAVTRG
ncbi:hypothetical protein SAMN05444365_101631 [Micromonospora pattaloongensis]|uniref:DUF4157 domain-containing protein n=1 Tax=Micromonospora pattaloongensis TaxID=405436 RepID=A0A1H3H2N7_9ACTN|nr:hypothetical protein [Micromonospora pattaloongensis]SDY09024.1 hypothetical protein SAMN05444365_101631 [Micromonospora pattaloongensis]